MMLARLSSSLFKCAHIYVRIYTNSDSLVPMCCCITAVYLSTLAHRLYALQDLVMQDGNQVILYITDTSACSLHVAPSSVSD